MNAAAYRIGFCTGLLVIVFTRASTHNEDEAKESVDHINNVWSRRCDIKRELQLLQVQSNIVSGKDRLGKPPRISVRTSPELSHESHKANTYLGDTNNDSAYSDDVAHTKDFLSGFTRLFVSTEQSEPASKSHSGSQKVYGFNGMYCERRFGGALNHHDEDGNHGPEILNAATASCIFFTGMYQLIFWNHQSAFIRLLCALVVINGWSSALRHWADIPFCSWLDGMTMVVGAVLGCCFMVDLAAQRARSWVTTAVLRMAVWAGMPVLFCLCFMGNPHSFDPHKSSMAFRVMFALPLLCVAIAIYGSLWGNWVTWQSIDDEAMGLVKHYLTVGIPLCCMGAMCMGLSELLCEGNRMAQYFPGHALWHVLFPIGVNALLLYICILWSDTKHQTMTFYKGSGWQARWYAIAPSFSSGVRMSSARRHSMP